MKCSLCKRRDAVYAIKTVLNGRLRELRLCPECIAKKEEALGLEPGALMYYAVPIALTRLEKDIFPKDRSGLACPACGLSWNAAKQSRALGCGHCYRAFRQPLELVFRLTQGRSAYTGAGYSPPGGDQYLKYALLDMNTLSAELDGAIKTEDFEKARALDSIRRRLAPAQTRSRRAKTAVLPPVRAKTALKRAPAWLDGSGPYSHTVLFSAARVTRNLAGYNFDETLDERGRTQVSASLVRQARELPGFSAGRFLTAEPADAAVKRALAERYLLEGDPYGSQHPVTAVLPPGQELALVINDREHAKLYAFESGLNAGTAARKALAAADELGRRAPLGFSKWCGFHTARPGEAGTGLRLFALINLPALSLTGRVSDVLKNLRGLHLASAPLNPEAFTLSGPLHIISSVTTLGSAAETTAGFERGLRFLLTSETAARIELASGQDSVKAEDAAFRALGILQNARSISYEETAVHLSNLLLGAATGFALPVRSATAAGLLLSCCPGHIALCAGAGNTKYSPGERDVLRAALLRAALAANT
ncbi:MAG: hypothetical protein PHW69_04905 [Elusimicrobiaceae bacterium]|nr:hypothetical protein [Elusimicrobiaceae bacterium]